MVQNHFTATGFVFNSDGKILMIKHKKLGVWLPPGGHIEENELPCKAVLREVFEETGVRAKVISVAPSTDAESIELPMPMEILLEDIEGDESHNHIDMVYLCRAENSTLNPQESEIDDIGWFTPAQIMELETFDNVRNSVKKAKAYHAKTPMLNP
ncbi:MAG: NUDIX hydrolase [Oscillospiraceae bacterium]|nr:NUDIX hydrolase [Oscillospiraceae bacterium]